jgi:hypothetical protein
MTELILELCRADWHSANDRLHWAAKAKRNARIREAAALAASGLPRFTRAHIIAHIGYPRAGRADPSNAFPVIKAALDGLVDAGIFPDDDSEHIIGPTFRRDTDTKKPGAWRVRLEIQEHP